MMISSKNLFCCSNSPTWCFHRFMCVSVDICCPLSLSHRIHPGSCGEDIMVGGETVDVGLGVGKNIYPIMFPGQHQWIEWNVLLRRHYCWDYTIKRRVATGTRDVAWLLCVGLHIWLWQLSLFHLSPHHTSEQHFPTTTGYFLKEYQLNMVAK